jgi:hypothetical protein
MTRGDEAIHAAAPGYGLLPPGPSPGVAMTNTALRLNGEAERHFIT